MSSYLLILSANREESTDATSCLGFARELAEQGHTVTVFLVQNAIFAARGEDHELSLAANVGVRVLADEFSMRERGVSTPELHQQVSASPPDIVIDRLAAGDKVVWH